MLDDVPAHSDHVEKVDQRTGFLSAMRARNS